MPVIPLIIIRLAPVLGKGIDPFLNVLLVLPSLPRGQMPFDVGLNSGW